MNRSRRHWPIAAVGATAFMVTASFAWACVGLMSLTTTSSTVPPGGTVTVIGREFAQGAPIEIHLDSPDGPVLATVPPLSDTMTSQFRVPVTIPTNIQNGPHVLVATEAYHYMNVGTPARAAIYVGVAPPASAVPGVRPAKIPVSSGPSALSLILIALGVAAVGLVLAGLWSAAGARRQPPQAVTAR